MAIMAKVEAVSTGGFDDEHERDFCDFISSIAVTKEELVEIVNMPDYSIAQVKQYVRNAKLTRESLAGMGGPRVGHTPGPALARAEGSSPPQPLLTQRSRVKARKPGGRQPQGKIFQLSARAAGQVLSLPERS